MNLTKVLLLGANGLVGNAIKQLLTNHNDCICSNSFFEIIKHNDKYVFMCPSRQSYDLTNEKEVENLFKHHTPDIVINCAASVGGIQLNLSEPAKQFRNNILMNTHVIHYASMSGVQKYITYGSVCAFPANEEIFKESNYLDGQPFPAHKSYAQAKRMIDIMLEAYYKQFGGMEYCVLLPSNLYGPYDNFNLINGHVIPTLIHKCYLAKQENKPFTVWGTGEAKREFIYAHDLANITLDLLDMQNIPRRLIVSSGQEFSIKEIAQSISNIFDYQNLYFDKSKPEGQTRRISDLSLFNKTFPNFQFTDLQDGLKNTCKWFEQNYHKARK